MIGWDRVGWDEMTGWGRSVWYNVIGWDRVGWNEVERDGKCQCGRM